MNGEVILQKYLTVKYSVKHESFVQNVSAEISTKTQIKSKQVN